jgi:diguanylate cyclase (GGDEF)-like protein
MTGAPLAVLFGGWMAKMGAVACYSALAGIYLHWAEPRRRPTRRAPRLADVFDLLTYRERYEDLLARSGRDALTGTLDRGRLESQGRRVVDDAALSGRPASVLLVDIDHFKNFNDRYGHAAGDGALKRIAGDILAAVRSTDLVFRFGGEEFVVVCDNLAAQDALALGERIRRTVAAQAGGEATRVTVSIGIASCADDAADYDGLFAMADERLYAAKAIGRNRVVGVTPPETDASKSQRLALVT